MAEKFYAVCPIDADGLPSGFMIARYDKMETAVGAKEAKRIPFESLEDAVKYINDGNRITHNPHGVFEMVPIYKFDFKPVFTKVE